eukprot:GHVH01002346.1.p1 GENE.GHVH01002346.1~~GHVH01002346.1.p1  ORF type:complete len:559 (-),score=71.92 GHVH01002346.1:1436-3112(-)
MLTILLAWLGQTASATEVVETSINESKDFTSSTTTEGPSLTHSQQENYQFIESSQGVLDFLCRLKYQYDEELYQDGEVDNKTEVLLLMDFQSSKDEQWLGRLDELILPFLPVEGEDRKRFSVYPHLSIPHRYHLHVPHSDVTSSVTLSGAGSIFQTLGLSQWRDCANVILHLNLSRLDYENCAYTVVQLPRDRDRKLESFLAPENIKMKKVNSNNEGTIWRSICPGPSYNCNTTLRALSSEQISRLKAMIAKSGQRLLHSRPSGKCASQIPSPSFLTIPCVEEPGLSTSVVAMNVATRQEPRWVSLTEGFKTKGLVVLTDWRAVTEGEDRWMGQVNAEFPPMRIILQNLMSNDDIMGFSPELVSTQSGDHRNTVLVHVSEQWPLEAAARRGGFEPGSFENRKWILEISNDLESLIWLDASDRLSAQERIRHALALDQRSVAHTDSILALGDWINGLERPYVLRSGKARLVDGVMEIYPWYHLSAVTQRVHEGADNVETFVLYYDSNDWHSFKARKAWSQVAATLKRSESIAIVQIDVAQQAMDQTGELVRNELRLCLH